MVVFLTLSLLILKALYNIPEICHQLDVRYAVICPGSRNAPLSIGFFRHKGIETFVIPDERSAAYMALGMSQCTLSPVVVCSTSGTAVTNFYPAVTEAFYQKIPLIAITGDRPPELVDQGDGQTIRQQNIFRNHIKSSYTLTPDYYNPLSKRHAERSVSEALNMAKKLPQGPVHINVPIREPFYPESEEETQPEPGIKAIEVGETVPRLTPECYSKLNSAAKRFDKVLIVVGQNYGSEKLTNDLNLPSVPVVAECTANIFSEDNIVKYHDIILNKANSGKFETLKPDLLITIGEHFISKNLKLFLRDNPPNEHWHVGINTEVDDVFNCLNKIIPVEPEYFFKNLTYEAFNSQYLADWLFENNIAKIYMHHFVENAPFGEFKAIRSVLSQVPKQAAVHFGNSMPVRYGNLIPIHEVKHAHVFANRGTSGIDGSLSSTVGHCLAKKLDLNVIILGDMSFFYDRNGLWHNYDIGRLRIVLMNNHGGGIFKMIPGPRKLAELEEVFVTKQGLTAKKTAEDFEIDYYHCNSEVDLNKHLADFFSYNGKAKLLEIESSSDLNTKIFDEFRTLKNYGKQI